MMDRRSFLRNCSLLAAGVIAADQLELLDRLAPRRLFAGADFTTTPGVVPYGGMEWVSGRMIEDGGYEIIATTPPRWHIVQLNDLYKKTNTLSLRFG